MYVVIALFAGGLLIIGGLLGHSLTQFLNRGELRRQAQAWRAIGEQRRLLEAARAVRRRDAVSGLAEAERWS